MPIGQIVVDLIANNAGFVTGMTTASRAAKDFGRDVSDSFSRLGELAGSALAPFGEIGRAIGETFGQIGVLSASTAQSLSKLTGGMNYLAVGGGLAVGALAAVEAGAIGLTIHTAEAAAKLFVMSQATGVSIETLSGFAFAAKLSGLEAGTMEGGLGKLNKAMFAAGTAAPGTTNAFTRLHIAVRDSSGGFRETGDVLKDVAEKFAAMPDGAVKGALAIQLFGKSGKDMIPFLNQGRDGIEALIKQAERLGVVLDAETGEAAHRFVQNLEVIEGIGQGVEYQLMKKLLPALETIAETLATSFADKTSGLNIFIDGIVALTKFTFALGDVFISTFGSMGRAIAAGIAETIEFGSGLKAMAKASNPTEFLAALKETRLRQKGIDDQFIADNKKSWQDNANFIDNLYAKYRAPYTVNAFAKTDTSGVDLGNKEKFDPVRGKIADLLAEASEQAALANSISDVTANVIASTAAAKADYEIKKLNTQAEKDHKDALTASEKEWINYAFLISETGKAGQATSKSIEELITKTREQFNILSYSTAAHESQDPLAEQFAREAAALEPLRQKLIEYAGAIEKAAAEHRTKDVDELTESYQKQLALFGELQKAEHGTSIGADKNVLATTVESMQRSVENQRLYNEALAQGADALRKYNVEQAAKSFHEKNPTASTFAISESATEAEDAKRVTNATSLVNASQNYLRVLEQIKDLEFSRSQVIANGGSGAAVDKLVYEDNIKALTEYQRYVFEQQNAQLLGNAKLFDSQRALIEQWDAAALKSRNFGLQFRAVMNEVVLAGQDFGLKLAQSIGKAIDDLSTQLAKFVTTGKANFKEVFQGFEESIAKAGFQKLFSTVLGKLGFGGSGKPDGTAGNPLHVVMGDGLGGIFGKGGGKFGADGLDNLPLTKDAANDPTSIFSSIFSKMSSVFSTVIGSITSIFSKIGGGLGGLFGKIGSIFGGFLASGGDVTPGKAYVVGEKHPEFFVPKTAGHVTTSLKTGGSTNHYSTVNLNLHGVTDYDSFKRSSGQIMANLQRSIAIAHARNY